MSCLLIELRIMYWSFLYSHTSSLTVTNLCLCVFRNVIICQAHHLIPSKPLLEQSTNPFAGLFLSPCQRHQLFTALNLELDICCEGFKSLSPRWIIGVSLFYLSTFVLVIGNIKYEVCKWQMLHLGGTQWSCHSI